MDYGGPVTEHRTWQEICPEITWPEMYEIVGVDYKLILQELDNVPKEVIDICAGVDESSLTAYLELRNIVTPLDLEDNDLEDLKEEVREELVKYGEVETILIPPKGTAYAGFVYVRYKTPKDVGILLLVSNAGETGIRCAVVAHVRRSSAGNQLLLAGTVVAVLSMKNRWDQLMEASRKGYASCVVC